MKNVPYVKQFNALGECKNPIKTGYINYYPNRKKRREPLQKERLNGRSVQIIKCKDGSRKRILHLG